MALGEILVTFGQIWLFCGLATAAAFLAFGLDRLDESARGAFVFRPMLIPGLALLWPVVLWRWFALAAGRDKWARRHRPPRAAHGRVWAVLAALIPAIFVLSMLLNTPAGTGPAPVKLAETGR